MNSIIGHAALAATFFGGLQYFVLGASVGTSLTFAVLGGVGAAIIAYNQSRRGQ